MSITRQQAEILSEQLFPHANYLIRRRERAATKLSPSDRLYQDISQQSNTCCSGLGTKAAKVKPNCQT